MRPSKKSIRHMIETVHALTAEAGVWQETTALVGTLKRTLRGWANYFQVGMTTKAYRAIDLYTTMRLSRWLRNKHRPARRISSDCFSRVERYFCAGWKVHLTTPDAYDCVDSVST
jgi:hypothetical protein